MPVINDDLTLRNSQIFYEEMKMRRSCRQFSSRDVPLKVIQNLLKTAGQFFWERGLLYLWYFQVPPQVSVTYNHGHFVWSRVIR